MSSFQKGHGDWTQYRNLPSLVEVDFHYSDYSERPYDYYEAMGNIREIVLNALKKAYEGNDTEYILFIHGSSTSGQSKTTARSVVRGLMRSKDATPYVKRKRCIQHRSVFVAAIRPKNQ